MRIGTVALKIISILSPSNALNMGSMRYKKECPMVSDFNEANSDSTQSEDEEEILPSLIFFR